MNWRKLLKENNFELISTLTSDITCAIKDNIMIPIRHHDLGVDDAYKSLMCTKDRIIAQSVVLSDKLLINVILSYNICKEEYNETL